MEKLYEALAKVQGEMNQPVKNKTVTQKYQDKQGQWRDKTYSYADLGAILAELLPVTSKYGISIIQATKFDGNILSIVTKVAHESGQMMEMEMPSPKGGYTSSNVMQEMGSEITYLRRYSIVMLFGVYADDDDDANPPQVEIKEKPFRQKIGGDWLYPFANSEHKGMPLSQIPMNHLDAVAEKLHKVDRNAQMEQFLLHLATYKSEIMAEKMRKKNE